jgi:signal transduction histidine kinase/CheY-like chemotaxis protein
MALPSDSTPDVLPLTRSARWSKRVLPFVAHILREDADLLTRWRARLTAAFLGAVATLGLVPAVPMLSVGVARGMWTLVVVDLVALCTTFYLLLSRRVSNVARNVFLTGASFGLGLMSVIIRGPGSTVLGWLFMSVFLAAFLLGPRATVAVVVATMAVLGGVATAIALEWVPWAAGDPTALSEWLLTSLNFAFLIVVFAIANGIIIRLLETEDRARAIAELQLTEARRNEALGTLASGIAHDFNNLLVPVLANVEAVRATLPNGSSEDTALRDAQRSAERARDLVQRIITFGRGMNTERSALDPSTAALDAIELVRLSAPATVRITLQHDTAPVVRASAAELHQVLYNLITNAVHAVGEQGQVQVTVEAVLRQGRMWARLAVRDTGDGMDARTRERLFDPYFSTKAPGRGTGLGLPIVQSIVASLGGLIEVQSTPGAGSTFSVLLPEDGADGPSNPGTTAEGRAAFESLPDGEAREPVRGTRVLLVDDEPSVRRAATRLLESTGCVVTGANSAAEALAHVQTGAFDVLVTDFRMPGMSGLQLVAALRDAGEMMPVVLISGHLEDARRDGPMPEGIVLLHKPFSRASLADAIASALPSGERVAGL